MRRDRVGDARLVELAIGYSGRTESQFGRLLMGREPRTIQRWLAGEPVPTAAIAWVRRYLMAQGIHALRDLLECDRASVAAGRMPRYPYDLQALPTYGGDRPDDPDAVSWSAGLILRTDEDHHWRIAPRESEP